MKMILHDWTDSDSVKILTNIRDAMEPGYSSLLINEFVLPDQGIQMRASWYDITMLACMSGKVVLPVPLTQDIHSDICLVGTDREAVEGIDRGCRRDESEEDLPVDD